MIDDCPTCHGERYIMLPKKYVQRIREVNVGDQVINEHSEEQVGGMPTIDPNEKDFDKMTTRELRNVRAAANPCPPVCSEQLC